MRTTIDLDSSVLEQLRLRQRREGGSLGQLVSELLARALADTDGDERTTPLTWTSRPMQPLIDLADRDAVSRILDGDR